MVERLPVSWPRRSHLGAQFKLERELRVRDTRRVRIGIVMMGKPLKFALNGEPVELAKVDPRTTVLQYIRQQPYLQGTKLGCGEGGCGACTVLLSKYDPASKRTEELTINSCLAPLCSIDGCAITTTEGLKPSRKEVHVVHERLAGFHGSQCGFCTPGICMSIYGSLRQASSAAKLDANGTANGGAHCNGAPGLSAADAQKCIGGNICRCTGYRPILDTCKSFSGEVDVEDLGVNSFWESRQHADRSFLPPYDPALDPKFPTFLVDELEARADGRAPPAGGLSFSYADGGEGAGLERQWRTASSLDEAFALMGESEAKHMEFKLVVGNTSSGVYKDMNPQVYIDISRIPELQAVKTAEDGVEVGAGVSLTTLIGVLKAELFSESKVYPELAKHVGQIASVQVRNRGSLGGNLILAQKMGFDSDLATILVGAGAEVTVASAKGLSKLTLEEFLAKLELGSGEVLVSVRIPSWADPSKVAGVSGQVLFKTSRASPRPNGNAVAYVNAACLAVYDQSTRTIRHLRLAFGAFGGRHAVRAKETEKYLVGRPVSPAGLLEAVKLLRKEVCPPPSVHKAAYRGSLAVGFLFDFFSSSSLLSTKSAAAANGDCVENGSAPTMNGGIPGHGIEENGSAVVSALDHESEQHAVEFGTRSNGSGKKSKHPASPYSASQKFVTSKDLWPVAEPSRKIAVELQATGEAVYVDDVVPAAGTLYAAFVLSGQRPGKILGIDSTEALRTPGAVAFVSAKDIPGKNLGFALMGVEDYVFADGKVATMNDRLGVLVADSYEHAREAAAKVHLEVEETEAIYTIEEAVAKESFGDWGLFAPMATAAYGDSPVKGDHRIENAVVTCDSQYHFYMETQGAYAVPDEDGCLTVYSSNQNPEIVQQAVAASLGITMNSVRVITRRLGGGFGGKFSVSSIVATTAAVAAYNLRRPVKLVLDRQTDMRLSPRRHETKAVYSVDFKADGKITGLQTEIFMDAGQGKGMSALVFLGVNSSLRQYDWGSLRSVNKICKTNKDSRGIMRGPGEIQGHFIAQTVIEHVAARLGLEPSVVRERNMHSLQTLNKFYPDTVNSEDSYTMPGLWEKLKRSAQFEERQIAVKKFNASSKWVKRGIDIVTGQYETGYIAKQARVSILQDGSVVVEVGGIEMGQGLWTKVRQAVAYGLNKLWDPRQHPSERVELSSIRVVQNDSISLPGSEVTGGSTTSEASCQAALIACEQLVESLKPFLQQLREKGATPAGWESLVMMGKFGGLSLTASGISGKNPGYINFGACVSEVSVDLLTGSTEILQTDLLYDCGKSLNPAVDLGQVEGAFMMGVGFYLTEEWQEEQGKVISDGTWTYKPPTADNIPKRFNIELSNTKANAERILSSKASGEPPILLAKSVHSAVKRAITAARDDLREYGGDKGKVDACFRLDTPASMDRVKALCGFDNVEKYLASVA